MRAADITDRELVRKGELIKPLEQMTTSEKKQWENEMPEKIRQYLFSIGQPLVYKNKSGQYVAEHRDGEIEILED